jgi:hypothetical protein
MMVYKPKRVAEPRLIFDAASALAGQVEASRRISEGDKDRWYEAIKKATSYLMDGIRWRWELEDQTRIFVVASKERQQLEHRVNGICTCEAQTKQGLICWHRAARGQVELIEDVERVTLIDQPLAPPQCGRCGTTMFEHGGRLICPVCRHSRLIPVPPPRPRPALSAEQAMREINELFA